MPEVNPNIVADAWNKAITDIADTTTQALGTVSNISDKAIDIAMTFGPKLITAILILWIGLKVIKKLIALINAKLTKWNFDVTLWKFITSLLSWVLKVLLILTVLNIVWIQATSFMAILWAAGLAVWMALSWTLQNFAAGAMLMIFKPIKVWDFVEVAGFSATVDKIEIFNTYLTTGDNKVVIVPNAEISGKPIINYSTNATRRVDMVFWIWYNDDIDLAKKIILDILSSNEKVLKDPAVFIAVSELWDSAVNLTVRAWTDTPDYWSVKFDTTEEVKKAFDKAWISFPYPSTDVYTHAV